MRDDVGEFFRKRRSVARPASRADEPVIFRDVAQEPSWATATGMFETLGNRDLGSNTQPLPPIDLDNAPPILARRKPIDPAEAGNARWQTLLGDPVGIGDLVALRGLPNPDAMGLIVEATAEGAPVCVLGGFEDPPESRPHPRLRVEEDNLVALLRKAGGGEPIDTKRF